MKKVEAPTLEEAYREASLVLECSISELQCEVVQHPTKGVFGFMKKNAIIVATCKSNNNSTDRVESRTENVSTLEEDVATQIVTTVKEEAVQVTAPEEESRKNTSTVTVQRDAIVDGFFEEDSNKNSLESTIDETDVEEESIVYDELALHIENELKELMSHSCFAIDVVEVDVVDNTALIFIDGNDAALLIGKEGYRYNALSYMLFNWLHSKYELFIKLEIAEFLTTQQAMIKAYIKPVIAEVHTKGRAKTRFLDGMLVQVALEQLRAEFPNKYVAVKSTKDGKKFIVINEFNTTRNG